MKKRNEVLKDYKAGRPKEWAAHIMVFASRLMNLRRPAKIKYLTDLKDRKKKQVLILSTHSAYDDAFYVSLGIRFLRPNTLVGKHHIYKTFAFGIFLGMGVIPKPLYISDFNTAKSLMRLKKKGASFLVFPEGIQSNDGTPSPLNPSTVKMIRMLGLETIVVTSHGVYLTNPRFDGHKRKGHIDYTYVVLFSKEEAASLSEDEIKARLLEKFRYNEFAWNEKHQYKYKGKVPNATGLDNILFICPKCKEQYAMKVEGEELVCRCGSRVRVDECYNLIPADPDFPFKRIDLWYQWQRGIVEQEVTKEDFVLEYPVEHLILNESRFDFKGYKNVGKGSIRLDAESITYRGRDNGKDVELVFDIKQIPGAIFIPGKGNQFYYGEGYHRFIMTENGTLSTKVMMAVEILHNRHDEAWRESYEDMVANRI